MHMVWGKERRGRTSDGSFCQRGWSLLLSPCVPASLQGRVWDPQGEGEVAH